MDLTQDYIQHILPRLRKLPWIVLGVLLVILLRLAYLQVVRGSFYRFFSVENSLRQTPIPALRGMILDRRGRLLVENKGVFDLVLVPQYVADSKGLFETLRKHLGFTPGFLQKKWQLRKKQAAYQSILLEKALSLDSVSWFKTHKSPWGKLDSSIDLRGVDVRLRYERQYPSQDFISHLLGYVREIDQERLTRYQKDHPGIYRRGDHAGIRGLEEVWDIPLRGEDGFSQKLVNAIGREIQKSGVKEELLQQDARHGAHLKLTVDLDLQRVASDYFRGKRGAAVALDPRDGALLMMISAPTYDLNALTDDKEGHFWKQLSTHKDRYLLNRALQGTYPPGSTYKIINGIAALEEGVKTANSTVVCNGGYHFGNRIYGCWNHSGHGITNFFRSIVESCDVYYYRAGISLGIDRLAHYADAFGLGRLTGIRLKNERSGLVPTKAWKLAKRKEEWQPGETLSVAIGQGFNLVTPLQMAKMMALVVNGGKEIVPYVVGASVDPVSGTETAVAHLKPQPMKVAIKKETRKKMIEALAGVIANERGTAHHLSRFNIPMGGKTGTAQVVSLGRGCAGGGCGDHAWFVAFAPVENPKIVISILVENGGHGSSAAAPLAGELIKTYLESVEKPKGEKENEAQVARKF